MFILNLILKLGSWGQRRLSAIGRATIMLFYSLVGRPQFRKNFPQLIRQIYVVGVQSISIIVVSGLFIGMVLGLQGFLMVKSLKNISRIINRQLRRVCIERLFST